MERTRTIKVLQLCFLALLLIVTVSWYSHADLVEIKTETNKVEVKSNKAIKFFKNYNNKRYYYKVNEGLYRVKRTAVPFVYDKELIKPIETKYTSEDCGC